MISRIEFDFEGGDRGARIGISFLGIQMIVQNLSNFIGTVASGGRRKRLEAMRDFSQTMTMVIVFKRIV